MLNVKDTVNTHKTISLDVFYQRISTSTDSEKKPFNVYHMISTFKNITGKRENAGFPKMFSTLSEAEIIVLATSKLSSSA